ncbi:MAG: WYL domain-containing protein [Aestuariivita sp.]|nr:WYL domain-containing protein [Aestuariivita sp.]
MSESSVSRDQDAFIDAIYLRLKNKVVEKRKGKLHIRNNQKIPDKPIFSSVDLTLWLKAMLGEKKFIEIAILGRNAFSPDVLGKIVKAITDKVAIEILYYSAKSGIPFEFKSISPHALIKFNERYYIRAFDHKKGRFENFFLSKVNSCYLNQRDNPTYIDSKFDKDWNKFYTVEITCRDSVSLEIAKLDFNLNEAGCERIKIRRAIWPHLSDYLAVTSSKSVKVKIISDKVN